MSRSKLARFEANKNNPHIVELGTDFFYKSKGVWNSDFFFNDNDIVLELACGKGEYTVALSEIFPNKNFIGVDIKGARIFYGAEQVKDAQRKNAAFLRTHIENLENHFAENEISELWIVFPDPHVRLGEAKKRLTSERFILMYQKLVRKGGFLNLKTDNTMLYHFTLETAKEMELEVVASSDEVYNSQYSDLVYGVKTRYEDMFSKKGETIKFIRMLVHPK